jgi:hypothetical protein
VPPLSQGGGCQHELRGDLRMSVDEALHEGAGAGDLVVAELGLSAFGVLVVLARHQVRAEPASEEAADGAAPQRAQQGRIGAHLRTAEGKGHGGPGCSPEGRAADVAEELTGRAARGPFQRLVVTRAEIAAQRGAGQRMEGQGTEKGLARLGVHRDGTRLLVEAGEAVHRRGTLGRAGVRHLSAGHSALGHVRVALADEVLEGAPVLLVQLGHGAGQRRALRCVGPGVVEARVFGRLEHHEGCDLHRARIERDVRRLLGHCLRGRGGAVSRLRCGGGGVDKPCADLEVRLVGQGRLQDRRQSEIFGDLVEHADGEIVVGERGHAPGVGHGVRHALEQGARKQRGHGDWAPWIPDVV